MLSTKVNDSTPNNNSTAALLPPSDDNTGVYAARRSQHVSGSGVADGDLWQERLAVCEGSTDAGEPRLIVRSYYRNARTQDRIWDEPPSGAGTVAHANTEMRAKAETQKQELQMLLEMIPPEEEELEEGGSGSNSNKNNGKKKGLFGRFARKKKEKKQVDTSRDLNLQRAIARSMADQSGGAGGDDDPLIYYDDGEPSGLMQGYNSSSISVSKQQDDEDIELAKALSMSVETAEREACGLSEEEMLQRALARSREETMRQDASGVASLPEPSFLQESFTSINASPQASVKMGVKTDRYQECDDNDGEEMNQKIPLAPTLNKTRADPPSGGSSSIEQFDPYG